METLCNRIQEEIVWENSLSLESQEHIVSCQECGQLELEFSNLESLLDGYLDVAVPEHFTDKIMARISAELQPETSPGFLEFIFARLNFTYVCGLMVMFFGVILPSAA